jgi:predicted PurR-regulated permease PerM
MPREVATPGEPVSDSEQVEPEPAESATQTTEPAVDASEPAGETSEPAGETSEPAGETSEPAGETSEPAGGASEPAGGASEPAGTEPASAVNEPEDDTAEPSIEAVEEGGDPVPTVPRVVMPRWIQAVVLPLAILGLYELARAAGTLVLLLLIAAVTALILNPIAKLAQRIMPRGLSIPVAYLVVLAVFAGIGVLLATPIANQVGNFSNNFPHIVKEANRDLMSVQSWLHRRGIKVQIAKQGQSALQTLEKRVEKSSGSIVSFSRDLLGKVVTTSVDFVLILVLSVYFLVYGKHIGALVRRIMPPGDGTPDDDYPRLVQRAVSGYVRGQLLFSLVMGASCGVGLEILGLTGVFPDGSKYAVFFGVFYALMELIPYVGPIIGPIPAVLVALFTDPVSALWLLIFFVVLQQLEGHVVAPQVFRISLRINPILVILSLLIGYQLYSVPGALVALPLATIIRQTVLYLRHHVELESWGTPPPSST